MTKYTIPKTHVLWSPPGHRDPHGLQEVVVHPEVTVYHDGSVESVVAQLLSPHVLSVVLHTSHKWSQFDAEVAVAHSGLPPVRGIYLCDEYRGSHEVWFDIKRDPGCTWMMYHTFDKYEIRLIFVAVEAWDFYMPELRGFPAEMEAG